MKLFDLSGRVALVTGGNGGIGLGMAEGLAEAGAAVMVAGRNKTKNESAVAALQKLGAKAAAIEVDVTREADCRAMVEATVAKFGGLHILVNNAGTNIRKQPEEISLAEWRTVLDTNLTSAFMASQAAFPAMTKAGFGKIISIGSMMSIFAAPFSPAYGASKGGIVQFTKSLATRLGQAQHPGQCGAAGLDRHRAAPEVPASRSRGCTTACWRARRRRAGATSRDFAGTAVFLASAASDFVTGAVIAVDGGYSSLG